MWGYGQCMDNIKSIILELNSMFSMLIFHKKFCFEFSSSPVQVNICESLNIPHNMGTSLCLSVNYRSPVSE